MQSLIDAHRAVEALNSRAKKERNESGKQQQWLTEYDFGEMPIETVRIDIGDGLIVEKDEDRETGNE